MKRYFFLFLLTGGFCATLAAQTEENARNQRVQAIRIAIFSEVLQLTPGEAEGFWPVYNEYLDRREALVQQFRPLKQLDAMSDAEVEEQIRRHFERQQRELDLEKELVQKLRKILPLRKIARLPQAERQFRESLLKRLQEAREQRRMNRGLGPGGNRK